MSEHGPRNLPEGVADFSSLGKTQESYVDYLRRLGDDEGARDIHHQNQVIQALEPLAESQLKYLGKRERQWFPDQFLNDSDKLRENAKNLSPLTIAIFLGNAVTEKGLPAYMTALNKAAGVSDYTGKDKTPSAEWIRGWTAQELEHEEVMYGWALLSDRVNMRALNILNYNLIRYGFDPRTRESPYKGYAYTTPQELATKISHDNTGKLAKREGDLVVHDMSSIRIAPDENRHYLFNAGFMGGIFELDPDGATIAVDDIMTRDGGMVMPGALMSETMNELDSKIAKTPFFEKFEIAAQKAEIYTIHDYVNIFDTLIKVWKIEDRVLRSEKAEKAREHLIKARRVLGATADRVYAKIQNEPDPNFDFLLKAA